MAKLDLGQALMSMTPGQRAVFRLIQDAINNLGDHVGADPVGKAAPPPPVQNLNVKVSNGELAHVTIEDNNPINKAVRYFLEYDTDPNFSRPHIEHLGASRGRVLNLPTLDDDNNPQTYYMRAYSQYPGSDPGTKIPFGGSAPTPITLAGLTKLTHSPSTGSGTASPTGEQGGSGFGKVNTRQPLGPKRKIPV
jgi:hypothetical protein